MPTSSPSDNRGAASSLLSAASAFRGVGRLTRSLFEYAPRRTALAVLLLLTTGVTEALGITMLIPLLHVVGLEDETSGRGAFVEAIDGAADALGFELSLANVLLLFLVLAVVRAATSWQRQVLLAAIQQGFVDRQREQLYGAMASAKWAHLAGLRQSDMQHVLSSTLSRVGSAAFNTLQMAVSGVLTIAQLVVVVAISPAISLLALALGGVLFLVHHPLTRRSFAVGEQLTRANRGLFGLSTDFMTGLKLVKGHGAEMRHVERYRRTLGEARERQLDYQRVSALAAASTGLASAAILAAMVWFSVSLELASLAELAVTALIFMRVFPTLASLQTQIRALANTLPACEYARSMYEDLRNAADPGHPLAAVPKDAGPALRTPSAEDRDGLALRSGTAPDGPRMETTSLKSGLTLRHVSFAYNEGMDVLSDVSLDIPARQMTVVAGVSGAGKSTLADMLLGLLSPTENAPPAHLPALAEATLAERNGDLCAEVLIDGRPLVGETLRAWRESIAYAPQEPFLFHDTIRANLLWDGLERSEDELWQALRLAIAEDFVAAQPNGLDTVVGDRGSRLSGGERQRIVLARALLRRPTFLLLDEATSQLDAQTERKVAATLHSICERTTVVAIAHRSGVMQAADRVVLMESGRVVAVGTWQELRHRIDAHAQALGVV